MHFNDEFTVNQKSWQRQCVEMLCCLLGLICVANPNFHSFVHLFDVKHQHLAGSIYNHGADATSGSLAQYREYYSQGSFLTVDGQRFPQTDLRAGVNQSFSSNQGVPGDPFFDQDGPETQSTTAPYPESPDREPSDSDAPFFYTHVFETEACCLTPFELFLEQPLLVNDEPNFESIGLFSSDELGTIGARGPPTFMVTRQLHLI